MGGDTKVKPNSGYPVLSAKPVGQQIRSLYKDRLAQFTGQGQYENQNLLAMMYEGKATGGDHVKLLVYSPPDLSRPTFEDATSQDFKPTSVGQSFGPSWSTHWFKVKLAVPASLIKKEHLEFHWDAGNEGLIWTEDGEPLQGLTGGGERIEWILPKSYRDGKQHTFYIEMACNAMFGNAPGGDSIQPPDPNKWFQLSKADIVAVNIEARGLFVDHWIIGDSAREFPEDSWECHEAQQVGNKIIDTFKLGDQKSITECRKVAEKYIGKIASSSQVYDSDKEPMVYGIGHCHIDTCWLWPWAETKRKIARSWSNQCDLIDRYPEHRFCASQAQQYKWLETLYPKLYDRVKAKVKNGTFQPIGGSWVEHDTNMPSGESLVRQFLLGQRFFESHFGERCTTFWLPDTFGYSSQLPQLCRLAGMSRFFTQKLSWNNINNFPHTTFNWVSLDGSQVLCHMCPAETYTAEANWGDVRRSITQHKSMDQDPRSLLVFGKGDGGGGPTWQHLDKLRRCRGVSDTTGLLPRIQMGNSVEDFFDKLQLKAKEGTDFVTWYGELYFELHRGTYTTQANNKLYNRRSEVLMHDIEYIATLASLRSHLTKTESSYKYPKKDIDELWEHICLCQFHDCLPGSSIEMCYDDSDELYKEVFSRGQNLLTGALKELGLEQVDTKPEGADSEDVHALNLLPWERAHLIRSPGKGSEQALIGVKNQRPRGLRKASITELRTGVFQMSNSSLTLEVEGGRITSLYDVKNDRQVLTQGGCANELVIFDDKPLYWQAWDVEVFHLESRQELPPGTTSISVNSAERVSVVTEQKISKESWAKTTISLSASHESLTSMVEIDCEVEWRETMKFLKVEFPVDVRNTEASYETQYGVIKRPTHYNTSWDMAKFEVCGHKFADLSEHGYGVSILNDSKYGFAVCGNMMRLSLLRAPKAPDAHADMGRHHIRYAIVPHAGDLGPLTVRAGYEFNHQTRLVKTLPGSEDAGILFNTLSFEGPEALILDTIKRGEDDIDVSKGDLPRRKGKSVICRLYDSLGGKGEGWLIWRGGVEAAFKTNVLEDDLEELDVEKGDKGHRVRVSFRPFEVVTIRLQLAV
ncbi:MAG: Glycoside hydrolase, 38 vacuolar alpha mannosidase [Vezdaea aestivalis]|nr:MAG: Glycoside hydrolase, 38 vacuolar alpha mannosidase [Vezdaea aestivalis]